MNNKKKVGARSLASVKAMMLLALLAVAPLGALAQGNADSYPTQTVKWDKVPAENREVIEKLFADMILVPDGEGVKKFYISTHEVQKGLWAALMGDSIPIGGDSLGGSHNQGGGMIDEVKTFVNEEEILKDSISSSDIQQFITLLRKQTGKRFRLPTEAERLWAAECQLIDTIADAADLSGKGFHLALDTIAKAEQKMLVITAMDGTQSKYLLEGTPQVRIEKPYLIVSNGTASIGFPLEKLQHMHYEKATDEATAIEEVKVLDEKAGREHIDFSNLPADAKVSIYTLDGKLVQAFRPNGRALSLPLDALQSGIYLVKVNDVTYKIQKP